MERDGFDAEVRSMYWLPSVLDDASDEEKVKTRQTKNATSLPTLRHSRSQNLDWQRTDAQEVHKLSSTALRRSATQDFQNPESSSSAALRRSPSGLHEFSPAALKRSDTQDLQAYEMQPSAALRRSASGSYEFSSTSLRRSTTQDSLNQEMFSSAVLRRSPSGVDELSPVMFRRSPVAAEEFSTSALRLSRSGSLGSLESSEPGSPTKRKTGLWRRLAPSYMFPGSKQSTDNFPSGGAYAFGVRKSRSVSNQASSSLAQNSTSATSASAFLSDLRLTRSSSTCWDQPSSSSAGLGMESDLPDSHVSVPAPLSPPASSFVPMPSFIRSRGELAPVTGWSKAGHAPLDVVGDRSLARQIHHELHEAVPLQKLQELEAAGTLTAIPRNDLGELTSLGSILHAESACSPCAYWFKGICKYGLLCTYCHFVHEGQKCKRLRPSKQARMRLRRKENQANDTGSLDEQDANDDQLLRDSAVNVDVEEGFNAEPRYVTASPVASPHLRQVSSVPDAPVFIEGVDPLFKWSRDSF